MLATLAATPSSAESVAAPEVPLVVPHGSVAAHATPTLPAQASEPVDPIVTEGWSPSTHTLTEDGQTTLELYAEPVFRRDPDGWHAIDSTIHPAADGVGYEALGLVNPVHFGVTADDLVTIDTLAGPIVFRLDDGHVGPPTLEDGVLRYPEVFPGVDLEFRTDGGRLSKQFVIENAGARQFFRLTIQNPEHLLGTPVEGDHESWQFEALVAFGTGLMLPAPAAWPVADVGSVGLPGSAHQQVTETEDGYAVDLSVDPLWAEGSDFPIVLDPSVQWTDEIWDWEHDSGLEVGFAPAGTDTCDGGPCLLAEPVMGYVKIGDDPYDDPDMGAYLTYAGADLSALAGRQVSFALLSGYSYHPWAVVQDVCLPIGPQSTGADLAAAACGAVKNSDVDSDPWGNHISSGGWRADVTDSARAATRGGGATPGSVGFAIDYTTGFWGGTGTSIEVPSLRLVYAGYPVPRQLTTEQTFGCACWAGKSPANQATAADPVNTATGGLTEFFTDLEVAGVGVPLSLSRTYNSLDTSAGPLGPGWALSYGASLKQDPSGEIVFRDGTGTQLRFGAVLGGGYAPIDAAVSASLADGPDGTRVLRNLSGETMTFDADGRLVASADAFGQGVELAYQDDRLATVTDTLGQTLTFGWDQDQDDPRIVSVTSSDGRAVEYGYSTTAGARRLTSVTGVDGQTTTYAYSAPTGGLSSITDPLGNVSAQNAYDPATGRIIEQRDATDALTTFDWDPATQTATVTDPTGRTRQDVYNGLNLVTQVAGDGTTTDVLYDADNNPSATVDAADGLAREDYDDRDRLVLRVGPSPLFLAERWTYDDADHVTSYTDPDGMTTTYTYDALGHLTTREDPDGAITTFTYTSGGDGVPANLLATVTDPLNRTTTYDHDSVGNLVATTTPEGHTTAYTYDAAHRVTTITSPSGATTSYTYDAAGRVLTTTDPMGGVASNEYDDAGYLTETTDPAGTWVTYAYDEMGRVTGSEYSSGRTVSTTYDDAGRIAATTDPLGHTTTYLYDEVGRLTSTTDPLGRVTTNTYDDRGRLTSTTDPSGGITAYSYDVADRVVDVTDADGVTEHTDYDRRGNPIQVTNADGGVSQASYDAMGRVVYQSDGDWVTREYVYDLAGQLTDLVTQRSTDDYVPDYWYDRTTFSYDDDGNRIAVVDPRGNVPGANPATYTTTYDYDEDGRLVATTDPLGNTTTTDYDLIGRPITVADPTGAATTTEYDPLGRITAVTSPIGAETRYGYDDDGNVVEVTDPRGRATQYVYDAAGNLLSRIDPLGRVTSMQYDASGALASTVEPSGTATANDPDDGTIHYAYDTGGRLASVDYSDGTPGTVYAYTPAGRIASTTRDPGGPDEAAVDYTYDQVGRVITVARTGAVASTATYAYSYGGRVTGAAWSTGLSASFSYNAVGELVSVDAAAPGVDLPQVDYGYDEAGRVKTVTRRSVTQANTAYQYDAAGRLVQLTHTSGGAAVAGYQVTRDARGLPSQVTETLRTVDGSTVTMPWAYDYNAAGWLTGECLVVDGGECDESSLTTAYAYDAAGVRTGLLAAAGDWSRATTYAYDAADQLTTQTVDGVVVASTQWTLDGDIASVTRPDPEDEQAESVEQRTTNLAGELTSVVLGDGRRVDYGYDAEGNRTTRAVDDVVDASWVWDSLTGVPVRLAELDQDGDQVFAWLPDPTSSTGAVLAGASDGDWSWLVADPASNVAASVSVVGSPAQTWVPQDWQGAFGDGGEPLLGLGFAGQYLDTWTGLYDLRARDYDPYTGRFTSQDPVTAPVGAPYVSGFAYGFNNPLVFIDATGTWPSIDWGQAGHDLWEGAIGVGQGVGDLAISITPYGFARSISNLPTAYEQGGLGLAVNQFNPVYGLLDNAATGWDLANQGCTREAARTFTGATFNAAATVAIAGGAASATRGAGAAAGKDLSAVERAPAAKQLPSGDGGLPAIEGPSAMSSLPMGGAFSAAERLSGATAGGGTASLALPRGGATLTQSGLDHIVYRHWSTSGFSDVGRFAEGVNLQSLRSMIDQVSRSGTKRLNTGGRPGVVFEQDLGRIIGTNSAGNATSRLRVVVAPDGTVVTAFPY